MDCSYENDGILGWESYPEEDAVMIDWETPAAVMARAHHNEFLGGHNLIWLWFKHVSGKLGERIGYLITSKASYPHAVVEEKKIERLIAEDLE
jgi:hypothetical protein